MNFSTETFRSFFSEVVRWFGLTDLFRAREAGYVLSYGQNSVVLVILCIGIAWCFAGHLMYRFWISFVAMIVGFSVGSIFGLLFTTNNLTVLIFGAIGGIVFAILAVVYMKLGVFFLISCFVFGLMLNIINLDSVVFYLISLVMAIGVGMASFKYPVPVIIVVTSILGAVLIGEMVMLRFGIRQINHNILVIVLGILGVLLQFVVENTKQRRENLRRVKVASRTDDTVKRVGKHKVATSDTTRSVGKAKVKKAEKRKVATPEKAKVAVPEKAKVAVPEKAKATIQEEVKVASVDKAKVTVPEKAKVAVPEKAKVTIPEKAKIAVPEETKVAVPEEAKVAAPEEVKIAVPEKAKVSVPEETKVVAPENAKIAVPEETKEDTADVKGATPVAIKDASPIQTRPASPIESKVIKTDGGSVSISKKARPTKAAKTKVTEPPKTKVADSAKTKVADPIKAKAPSSSKTKLASSVKSKSSDKQMVAENKKRFGIIGKKKTYATVSRVQNTSEPDDAVDFKSDNQQKQ